MTADLPLPLSLPALLVPLPVPVPVPVPGLGPVSRSLLVGGVLTLIVYLSLRVSRYFARIRRMQKLADKIPGPPGLPLIGNLLDLQAGPDCVFELFKSLGQRFGPTARFWIGHEHLVCVGDPRDMEFICTSQALIDKSPFYQFLVPLLGDGLSTLGGEAIRRHRKVVVPSMHLDILHDFFHVFAKSADIFAEWLKPLADTDGTFDVQKMCIDSAISSVLQTIMSTDVDEESKLKYRDMLMPAMEDFMYRIMHPWLMYEGLYNWTKRGRETAQSAVFINEFCEGMIRKKQQQIESASSASPNSAGPPRAKRQAFVDNVLRSKDGATLSNLELRDEVKTLLATGSETTSSTLSILFQVIALRQDVQEGIVQELEDVFGGDLSRPLTMDELPHLRYMENVIKETMRLYPALPMFTRAAPYDVTLPSGYTVPKGAHICPSLPILHMDPVNFPDPEEFDPNRFLPENARKRHPFSYVPFSAGPRNCPGQRFAMMNLKAHLAAVLRRYRVLPPPEREGASARIIDIPVTVMLTLQVKGGSRIRLETRGNLPDRTAVPATEAAES